jgi:hypothetical protein
MFKTEEITTGNVSPDSRNAYFNPLSSYFSSSFGIATLEGRALFSLLGSSSNLGFQQFSSITCESSKEQTFAISKLMLESLSEKIK